MAKIILTADVAELGNAGDVVEVRDGYARNYLVPQNYATPWTRGGEKQVKSIKAAREALAMATVEAAEAAKTKLLETPLTVTVHTGAGGRLFGSVTTSDIAEAAKKQTSVTIDKRKITLPSHIKTVGEYKVSVKLHDEVSAPIDVKVVEAKTK